jgi:lipopolysaccharide biosynthesis regulator YciM
VPHSFPSQEAKDSAALKAFGDLAAASPGTPEGQIAEYYLGSIAADQGKLAEAETHFRTVAQKADANYASLAKLALVSIYFADGRNDDGDKILRDLMAHPTLFVSKDEAAITLARQLIRRNPPEARKLLEPIRGGKGPVATMAQMLYAELPPQ